MSEAQVARYWRVEGEAVRCGLCPHRCLLTEGKRGRCGVRQARQDKLYTLNYPLLAAAQIDPIEKKPLYHFYPGAPVFSVAAVGCNLTCDHCQNASLSDTPRSNGRIDGQRVLPSELINMVLAQACRIIAYTYSEPTVFYEYMLATAEQARARDVLNCAVSNAYIGAEPLRELAPYLDAANYDLKSFREEFYRDICGATLAPVLHAIEIAKTAGVWVEVTTLIIPGLNDSEKELRDIAAFLAGLDKDLPWHVSAFHPAHRMTDRTRTSAATVRLAREIGLAEGLRYVYSGNVSDPEGSNTFCPSCGETVIERNGFGVGATNLAGGNCAVCRHPIAGRGM